MDGATFLEAALTCHYINNPWFSIPLCKENLFIYFLEIEEEREKER